jgi:glycosyltransferase involved in cell wall biosynthesis
VTSPHLSVVIPAYNHARWVEAAIASVAAQSLGPADIVVVDDGSTDGTGELLASLDVPGLRVVRQENQGAHAALNRAIAMASGRWVAILNSDDTYGPERLEESWGVARATGALLVLGRVELVDETGGPLAPDHPVARWYAQALEEARGRPSLAAALARHNAAVTTSNFLLHRELWRRVGGFRPYRYVHDLDFLLRASALAPGRVVLEPSLGGVAYRVHGGNTIREDPPRALAERAAMLGAHRGLLRRARRALGGVLAAPALRDAARRDAGAGVPSAPAKVSWNREPRLRCGLVVSRLDAGGLEEVVAMLATGLPDHGFESHVLCTDGGGAVARRLEEAGIPVTVARDAGRVRLWIREVRPKLVSTHAVPARVVRDVADAGVPAVETVHNTYAWFSESHWEAEREKAGRVQALIAVSETAAAYYRRYAVPGAPIHVVPNGVAPGRVVGVPRPFARRVLGVPGDAAVLVNLARFAPEKDQLGLVTAFRELAGGHPGLILLLAGPGHSSSYAAEVRREAGVLLQAGRVRILAPREDVGVILSAADVFVSHSWFEGWSLAATEALWLGRPVVLSDCGGSRELVGEGGARGRVVPNALGDPLEVDADALARAREGGAGGSRDPLRAALEEVLADLDAWRGRREAIRAHARARWPAQEMVRRYAAVFRTLCGAP